MSSEPHSKQPSVPTKKISQFFSFFARIKNFFVNHEPEDRADIQEVLTTAHAKDILDDESYTMISGTLSFAEKQTNDIMLSRSKLDLIDVNLPIKDIVTFVIETAHSRFPVYEEDRDNIIGLLLAKDLLRYLNEPDLDVRSLLRPMHFVPETKRLNRLLKEFKDTHNHLAIVVDEYGSVTGLVTMEDILEQIVGEIEDEYDEASEQTVFPESKTAWRLMGRTPIEEFNKIAQAHIPDEEYNTVGGWLAAELDHIPMRGDTYQDGDIKFLVLRANERHALWIHARRVSPAS